MSIELIGESEKIAFMKIWILLLYLIFFAFFSVSAQDVYVKGYYRKDGTYVQPHYRSAPDGNPYNNYSYPGNYNPYTGKIAGGSEAAYLASYYKVYHSYSSDDYANYGTLLRGTNYSNLDYNSSRVYEVHERSTLNKTPIGYINPVPNTRFLSIHDINQNFVGYIKMSKNRKRYSVYTVDDVLVSTNKPRLGAIVGKTLLIGAGVFLTYAAISSTAY